MKKRKRNNKDVMGGYKYLRAHQIAARLEVFKRTNCQRCPKLKECDYSMYLLCKGKK
jgi:hypothetical protein